MQYIEGTEEQTERKLNDWYAFLFEFALLVLVLLLLSFTAHAQEASIRNVEWNEVQIGASNSATLSHAVQNDLPLIQAERQDVQKDQTLQKAVVQGSSAEQTQMQTANQPGKARVIVISVTHRKLALLEDGKIVKIYTIAVGKKSTPTPSGTFSVISRVNNPIWSHKGKVAQPGPANPVGSRWIGLSLKGYGIHGTNEPNSIGRAASHGCIRMAKQDIEELFTLVAVGDEVNIHTVDDVEVATIFDAQPNATQDTQTAANTTVTSVGGQL